MSTTFFYSDPHFSHKNICVFTNRDGSKVRPFDNEQEMDEELVRRFNNKVGPKDKVYFLGDVAINRRGLDVLARLNGDKVLIRGNHDIFPMKDYTKYFRDLRGCHVMDGCILTHIPIHKESIARFSVNIHGHTHSNRVMKTVGWGPFKRRVIDPDYFCVCVEQHDFAPISVDDAYDLIKKQGGRIGFRNGNGPTAD
jgi:calcineurin-like phosphoesterase family protein